LSTTGNWEREFSKWAPDLYFVTLTGNSCSREVIKHFELSFSKRSGGRRPPTHVVITSYEILILEKAFLSSIAWEAIIVDEGQRLKNQESKLFRDLSDFNSQFRLLLTGTPLQNNLKELFTLLSFLEPDEVFIILHPSLVSPLYSLIQFEIIHYLLTFSFRTLSILKSNTQSYQIEIMFVFSFC